MSGKLAPIPGIGSRVFFQSLRKWGEVVVWPKDAVKNIIELRGTHLCVQPIDGYGRRIGQPQYWPLTSLADSDRPGTPTIRPFVTRVEGRKAKAAAKAQAKKPKTPPPDDDADVPPDKPLAEEPLERED